MSGFGAGRAQKAKQFEQAAQKSLKPGFFAGLFAGDTKFEGAAENYAKAAAQYKIAKQFKEAGRCYELAAQNNLQTQNTLEATTNYREAAKAWQNSESPDRAIGAYTKCTQFYLDNDRFNAAGKIFCDIAKINREEGDLKAAIQSYDAAVECFQSDNDKSSANKRLLEIADLSATLEDYKRAIEIYENVASDSIDNNLLRWSVKGYYFKSMLCQLCIAAKTSDVTAANEAFERYQDLSDLFVNTREANLVQSILQAFEAGDLNQFKDAVAEFEQISPLDDWKSRLLFTIQSALTGDAPAAMPDFGADNPDGAPAQDDDPDFS